MLRDFHPLINVARFNVINNTLSCSRALVDLHNSLLRSYTSKITTLPWVIMVHPEGFSSGPGVVRNIRGAVVLNNTRIVHVGFEMGRVETDWDRAGLGSWACWIYLYTQPKAARLGYRVQPNPPGSLTS